MATSDPPRVVKGIDGTCCVARSLLWSVERRGGDDEVSPMNANRPLCAPAIALASVLAALSIAAATPSPPDVDPANFVRGVDNPYFPLEPGTTFVYEGTKEGVPTHDEIHVTHETKVILGVSCIVLHHQAFENGTLVEDTFDFHAQDADGNVWYFGEDTRELDPAGNVISTEGSWEAGVNDADAGIIMEAHPRVSDRYYQEFLPGVAEDQARVLSLQESVCVGYGCFDGVLLTRETTRLEPGAVEQKYYAKGVGFVLGVAIKGSNERSELIAVNH